MLMTTKTTTTMMMMEQKKKGSEVIHESIYSRASYKFILIENRDAVYSCCPSRRTCWQQTPKKSLESFISNWKLRNIFFFSLFWSLVCLFVCLFVRTVLLLARARYFDRLSPVTNSSLIIRFQAAQEWTVIRKRWNSQWKTLIKVSGSASSKKWNASTSLFNDLRPI